MKYMISELLGVSETYYGLAEAIVVIFLLFLPVIIGSSMNSIANKYFTHHKYNVKSIEYTGKELINKYIYNHNMSTQVRIVSGRLTDYYDVDKDYIYLSESTYSHRSLLSVCIALHEFSHAILFKEGEKFHQISFMMSGFTERFCARMAVSFSFIAIIMSEPPIWILFTSFMFSLLYIIGSISIIGREYKASANAIKILKEFNTSDEDLHKCKVLLRVCWVTYVAQMISILTITFLMLFKRNE